MCDLIIGNGLANCKPSHTSPDICMADDAYVSHPVSNSSAVLQRSRSSDTIQSDHNINCEAPDANDCHVSNSFHDADQFAQKKLLTAMVICLLTMAVEVVAGIMTNSLALLTDAAHLLSDLCSFAISYFAIWVSKIKGNPTMSFGYHRAEILGAVTSVLMIWLLTVTLVYHAILRFSHPQPIKGSFMFLTAVFGTLANIFMTYILGVHVHGIGQSPCKNHCSANHSHDHAHHASNESDNHSFVSLQQPLMPSVPESRQFISNRSTWRSRIAKFFKNIVTGSHDNVNLRAAYAHALGDLLQNIGVMIASAIVWVNPKLVVVDPICTLMFSIFVVVITQSIIKEAVNVLMEGTPIGFDMNQLQSDFLSIQDVVEVHDLHVWSLSVGKPALACHLVLGHEKSAQHVLKVSTSICQLKYRILHTTIQTDFSRRNNCCETSAHKRCLSASLNT